MTGILALALANPLFGVALTVGAYAVAVVLHRRLGRPSLLHPVLSASVAVALVLIGTDMSYERYFAQAFPLHAGLGVVVVLLAVPLYRQLALIRAAAPVIAITLFLSVLVAFASTLGYPVATGASETVLATLAAKSTTAAVAVQIAEQLGGAPALTVIIVIASGIFGGAFGPSLLSRAGVTDDRAVGLALGISSHAIGTARALQNLGQGRGVRLGGDDPECRHDDLAGPDRRRRAVKTNAPAAARSRSGVDRDGRPEYAGFARGYSLMVKPLPSKQAMSVRFRLPAPAPRSTCWRLILPARGRGRRLRASGLAVDRRRAS